MDSIYVLYEVFMYCMCWAKLFVLLLGFAVAQLCHHSPEEDTLNLSV